MATKAEWKERALDAEEWNDRCVRASSIADHKELLQLRVLTEVQSNKIDALEAKLRIAEYQLLGGKI